MIFKRRRVGGRPAGPPSLAAPPERLWHALGALFVIATFAPPLVLLVAGSLHQPGRPPPPRPQLVPDPVSTTGYGEAMRLGELLHTGLNSLIVATLAVPVSVLVASLAGFALAHLAPRLGRVVLGASLVALMVPATALLVPRFTVYRWLGLTDTLAPLVAPALVATSPLYVLVYYVAFRALPRDLYDACQLEGLTPLQTWWRVALPLVRPVTAAVVVLTFMITWSNFLDPLVYIYDRDLFTIPLALRSLATLDPTDFPIFLAGAVIATVPAVIVFAVTQRRLYRYNDQMG